MRLSVIREADAVEIEFYQEQAAFIAEDAKPIVGFVGGRGSGCRVRGRFDHLRADPDLVQCIFEQPIEVCGDDDPDVATGHESSDRLVCTVRRLDSL